MFAYRPPSGHSGLVVFAAPLAATTEAVRTECEAVLHSAFRSKGAMDSISLLVGLRTRDYQRQLRSRSRAQALGGPAKMQRSWLIWQTVADPTQGQPDRRRTVGAAIMEWQVHAKSGPKHLRGGAVLEYIAARRDAGARGFPMVLAAEEVCRLLGLKEIFSACDLTQEGQAFGGKATAALTAHRRWGFQDIDAEEWAERRFGQYSELSDVHYMVKPLRVA